MMNINSSLVGELREKEYRDAYVESQIRMTLPLQVRELRKRREWTQPELAERAGMGQPRISELEKPGERRLTIETLLRLASAFDVALQVRFVPYGDLIDWSEGVEIDNFDVRPFEVEIAEAERAAVMAIPRIPPRSVAAGAGASLAAGGTATQIRSANMPSSVIEVTGELNGNYSNSAFAGSGIRRNG